MTEEIHEHIDEALELAVVNDADLDEVEAALQDGINRIEAIRRLRGES